MTDALLANRPGELCKSSWKKLPNVRRLLPVFVILSRVCRAIITSYVLTKPSKLQHLDAHPAVNARPEMSVMSNFIQPRRRKSVPPFDTKKYSNTGLNALFTHESFNRASGVLYYFSPQSATFFHFSLPHVVNTDFMR